VACQIPGAPFIAVSAAIILLMRTIQPWFFSRYGNRVIEPELKGAFAALFVLMYFAEKAQSHAVLPAFILGLGLAKILASSWPAAPDAQRAERSTLVRFQAKDHHCRLFLGVRTP
jgi:Kef-type K+ transport system membrane component KefB